MKFYAQLDKNNKVVGISQLKGAVSEPHMIEISEEDYGEGVVLGRLYENGEFIEAPPEPEPEPTYEEEKARYLSLIKDAQTLGEDEEVERLQQEWKDLKIGKGW
ncbi:hypothetical protein [Tindallia californiensis]|uniref:Uncharacterized protein n=1 Tax=Tindallia californiensis TaxID=159292 RepID=A0A1H3R2R5_9FIRM|nr:hypothetical protein [Tindallia californiensis]SDZ19595.1 hypothetical protein SAMN05192546_11189 [Tindallia californiensis]